MENSLIEQEFAPLIPMEEVHKLNMQMYLMKGEVQTFETEYGAVQLGLEFGGFPYGALRIYVRHASSKPYIFRPTVIKKAVIFNEQSQLVVESTSPGAHKIGRAEFNGNLVLEHWDSCKILQPIYTLAAPGPRTIQS